MVVGSAATFVGMVVGPKVQRRMEEAKLLAARQDAIQKEILVRIQQMVTELSIACHSICWLTWFAKMKSITQKNMDDYNTEMHTILPKIFGTHAAILALDGKIADKVEDILKRRLQK